MRFHLVLYRPAFESQFGGRRYPPRRIASRSPSCVTLQFVTPMMRAQVQSLPQNSRDRGSMEDRRSKLTLENAMRMNLERLIAKELSLARRLLAEGNTAEARNATEQAHKLRQKL